MAPPRYAVCALLALAVLLCFASSLRNGFTGYDDPEYVTANPHVNGGLSLDGVAWAFTSAHSSNWHPLTWLSHALDCTLFGLSPAGHHFISLLLHVLNTVLLFLWLFGITGAAGRSAFVALVFGVHPVHVESVAWVAERKDVLSTFFGLLALRLYSAYSRQLRVATYLGVALMFAASLASKPMLVTLPLLLLLLDWWPLGRAFRPALFWEKLPLAAISAASCALTLWAQRQGGSVAPVEHLPVSARLANAVVSYARYLGKTAWPQNLSVFYPFPPFGVPGLAMAASLALLAAVTTLAIMLRTRHPWIAMGWGWYMLTLLPVIGLVQVGMQSMADRYLYVPMIGLLIAITWECAARVSATKALAAAGALAAGSLAFLTWQQAQVWKDGMTLFAHAARVTRDNFVAHDNLGVELDRRGRFDEALAEYRETLRIRPEDRNGQENLAQALFAKGERHLNSGRFPDAASAFQEGLRLRPGNRKAHLYLARACTGSAVSLAQSGQPAEARRLLEEAVGHDPSSVEARYDLGLVLAAMGETRRAIEAFDSVLRLRPDYAPAKAARAQLSAPKTH